jgi:hypothetical protein
MHTQTITEPTAEVLNIPHVMADQLRASRHMPEVVQEIAWKAQARLTKRYRALVARGKRSAVPVTAIAREIAAFHVGHRQNRPPAGSELTHGSS